MSEDLSRLRPEELAKELREWVTGVGEGRWTVVGSTRVIAVIDEMERRLKEVDNCICWGVDCVHQAKAWDDSYALHCVKEKLDRALKKYVPHIHGGTIGGPNDAAWALAYEVRRVITPHPPECPCQPCVEERDGSNQEAQRSG